MKMEKCKVLKKLPPVLEKKTITKGKRAKDEKQPKIYLFGVNRVRLEQMARDMQISLDIVNNPNAANIFITSKAYYRTRPQKIMDAEAANIPIYVLKKQYSQSDSPALKFDLSLGPPERPGYHGYRRS